MRTWLKILPVLAGLGFLPGGCNSEEGEGLLVYETINEAAKKGDLADVKRHLHRGVAINTKDGLGCTPLHVAAAHGRLDVVRFLISKGADVNAGDNWGRTPLHMIVREGPSPVMRRWDWDIADGKNVGQDRLAVMKLLIANGADVNARDHSRTPLFYAVDGQHQDAEELLRQHGAEDPGVEKGTNPYWDIISGAGRTSPAAGAPKKD